MASKSEKGSEKNSGSENLGKRVCVLNVFLSTIHCIVVDDIAKPIHQSPRHPFCTISFSVLMLYKVVQVASGLITCILSSPISTKSALCLPRLLPKTSAKHVPITRCVCRSRRCSQVLRFWTRSACFGLLHSLSSLRSLVVMNS